jgi:predicted nucleotidyltransferase
MLTCHDILAKLQSAKPALEKKYNIKTIALFGSYSRTDATPESDIDLLVDFKKPIGIEFVDFAYELEFLLQHKVDLVSLKGIKPKYLNAIQPDLIYV